jgi:hypothetical protein
LAKKSEKKVAARSLTRSARTIKATAAKSVNAMELAASMLDDLAVFASRFKIAPVDAYVLSALFGNAAAKVGMAQRTLVAEATFRNKALGEHLANAARMVAAEDRIDV